MSRAIISKERFSQLQGKEDEESNRPAFPHTKSESKISGEMRLVFTSHFIMVVEAFFVH